MTLLLSIPEHHLVLNCRCGHVGQISVAELIGVHGGDVSVDAVERAAKCSRCKMKGFARMQIIYIGSSDRAFEVASAQRAHE